MIGDHCDIVVVGGGPAGSVTALGLARLGYAVAMIHRARRQPRWEGLAPRAYEGLRSAGCDRALAVAGSDVARLATWNGETRSLNRERLVERTRLDAALVADAEDAGVNAIEARVRRYEARDGGWTVTTTARDGTVGTVEARFLVEARGRDAPLLGARRTRGPATTALCRAFHCAAPVHAMTALAPFPDGWAWAARTPGGRGLLQIVVSSRTGALPGRHGLAGHFDRMRARIPEAREWLDGATLHGPVWTRNAAPMLVTEPHDAQRIRVGDAAAAIDPLSGHGAFEAVAAGLAAPAVINTILRRPEHTGAARRFLRERAQHGFWRHCRVGRDFYRTESRWRERPFWSERRDWPDDEPAHPPPLARAPRIERRPVIDGAFVTEAEVIVTADHPRGVWRVAGVPLATLVAAGHVERAARAARRLGHRESDLRAAIGWLSERGLIAGGPARAGGDAGPAS